MTVTSSELTSSPDGLLQRSQQPDAMSRERIVYVAPDCTDSGVKKRAHGFVGLGHELTCFSFRRERYNVGYQPDWPNVELGKTVERRIFSRVFVWLKAIAIIFLHRRTWREATMIYVRNLDLALLALVGKAITRSRAPLVYQILDIHPAFLKRGLMRAVMRWLERRVLKRSEMLVVTSPAFLRNYFEPVQRFQGKAYVLENKWPREGVFDDTRKLPFDLDKDQPVWTIGWLGNIRCEQSLEILTELADALPDRVRIYIRGCDSLIGEETLRRAVEGRANVVFEGEYEAPDDLPEILSKLHFNWCVDFSGYENGIWLLPNRIYEGGYFGIPALAIASHETGRVVQQRRLGFTLDEPYAENLKELLLKMTYEDYLRLRHSIEEQPVTNFVDTGDLEKVINIALSANR